MVLVFIHHVSTRVQAGDLMLELALTGGSKSGGTNGGVVHMLQAASAFPPTPYIFGGQPL